MIRSFIAIDFPAETTEKISRIISFFKQQTPDGTLKWVEPQNLHLPLKFLGDIPENQIKPILSCLDKTLKDTAAFEISIGELGMFPTAKAPRVVWLGIRGAQPLTALHQELDQALKALRIAPDKKPFSPHLTIARVRPSVEPQTVQSIGQTLSGFKVDSLGTLRIDRPPDRGIRRHG